MLASPWRFAIPGQTESAGFLDVLDVLLRLPDADRNEQRDQYWRVKLAQPKPKTKNNGARTRSMRMHAAEFGRCDDVTEHVLTFSGLTRPWVRLPTTQVQDDTVPVHVQDRSVTYVQEDRCLPCGYNLRVRVATHTIVLAACWTTANKTEVPITSITEGVQRFLLQHSNQRLPCPACHSPHHAMTRTKARGSTRLPARMVVMMDSTGALARLVPCLHMKLGPDCTYALVGVCMKSRGHYTAIFSHNERWFFYDDGPSGTIVFREVPTHAYVPQNQGRRCLYYAMVAATSLQSTPATPSFCEEMAFTEGDFQSTFDFTGEGE